MVRLCSTVLLCALVAHAQYRFESYTTDNGLPQKSIWAIYQARDGYIWFATGDGLVRFDGVHFRVFNSTNNASLQVNGFSSALLEARDGALWAGTWAGGAIRYYRGVFTAFTAKDGLPSNTVVRIDQDAEGTVWIFTNSGLAQWKAGRLSRVRSGAGTPFSFHAYPSQIIVNPDFLGLWRRDRTGLYRFAYGQWSRVPLPPSVHDSASADFRCWSEDSQRRLWCSVSGRPGESYRISNGEITRFKGLPRHAFVCYQDRGGGFWIGTRDEGLYHLRRQLTTVYRRAGAE